MSSDSQFIYSRYSDYQCSFDEDIVIEDDLNVENTKFKWLPSTKKVLNTNNVAQLFLNPTLYSNRLVTIIKVIDQKLDRQNKSKCLSEIIVKTNKPIRKTHRRISGIEYKSTKQQKFDEEYPITIIKEHSCQQLIQQSKRKKMFKRMSNILIKHTDSIKCQIQKHRDKLTPAILNQNEQDFEKSPDILGKQQQFEENRKQLKNLQNKIFHLSNSPAKFKTKYLEQKNNIILDLHKKSHRTFATVQNYLQEKSQLSRSQNTMPKLANINQKCLTIENTTQFRSHYKIQPQQIKISSLKQLPDLKQFRKQQNSMQGASKFSNIYLNSPLKIKKY